MNEFLARLGARDRMMLFAGGGILLVALLYGLGWRPISHRVAELRTAVGEQTALEKWMQSAVSEVKQLRGSQGANPVERQSLLSLADRTARQGGIGPAVRRVEPEGSDKVRVQLEQAAFDDIMAWIESLVGQYHVRIDSVAVEGRDQPGLVNARIVIQAPAP